MHHTILTRALAVAAVAAFATAPVFSQTPDGPYWSEYARPANMTNFRSIGTLAMIETPTDFHLFSGLHRTWTVQPVTAPLVLGVTNSYCLFQDGTTIHGYSTRTGRVASLATSGAVTVNIGSASSSWTAYVVDGNTVYGWSGFFGEWKALPIQGTLQSIGLGSHMISCADSQNLYGFSAFFGDWVATPNRSGGGISATWRNGCLAVLSQPDEVKGFSVYRNVWASNTTFPSPALSSFDGSRDGYAYLHQNGGSDVLWFSALAGQFAESHEPVGTSLRVGPNCAVVVSPNGLLGYSPSLGVPIPLPAVQPNPTIQLAAGSFGAYALVDDGVSVFGFSGLTGVITPMPFWAPYTYALGDTAAFATGPSGLGFAYSALRNQWVQAPTDLTTDVRPQFEGIIRVTNTGFEGFSARTGTFASLSASGNVVMLAQGAIAAIVGTDSIDVFDPAYGRWEHQDTGSNPTFGVHRLVGVGRDATHLYGYSLFTNTWEARPFQGTFGNAVANSSIGYAATSSHYYIWTGNGSLSNHSRFPEFSRFCTVGAPLVHLQCGNPGAFVFGLFSFTGAENNTPFGVLRVDPNPIVLSFGVVPSEGILRSPIPIPDDPALRGLRIHMQDFVVRSNGTAFLSNAQAPYLW